MSIEQRPVLSPKASELPKNEVLAQSSPEVQRNIEIAKRVGRAQSFMDQQASRMEDYLLEVGNDVAAGQLSTWFRQKRANYKTAVQGLTTPDPELGAFTLMAGLASERHRGVARDPNLDGDVAREAADTSKLSGAIFAQEMSGKMLGGGERIHQESK